MSDENTAGGTTPEASPPASGAFDWLRESHQQTTPLAPLSDDIPSPAPASPAAPFAPVATTPSTPSAYPEPTVSWGAPAASQQVSPPVETPPFAPARQDAANRVPPPPVLQVPSTPPPLTQPPAPPVASAPPTWSAASAPTAPPPVTSQVPLPPRPSFLSSHEAVSTAAAPVQSPPPLPPVAQTAQPAAPTVPASVPAAAAPSVFPFAGLTAGSEDVTPESLAPTAFGGAGLGLERHEPVRRSTNGPLDWISLVLAIILPPIGVLASIAAMIVGSRTRGFASSVAKVALVIGIVLSIAAGVGAVVFNKMNNDQAHHDAIVASSKAWCTSLQSDSTRLSSPTYNWPAPANTIPDSITSMQAYVDTWTKLTTIAPAGIKAGTGDIAAAAKNIVSTVTSTQTLDDASDVSTMSAAVSNSGIAAYVKEYCN